MSKIIPRIFLGNKDDANNFFFIADNNIDIIVNATKDLPLYHTNVPEITYYRFPVDDNLQESEFEYFRIYAPNLIKELFHQYVSGKSILIHCFAGKQRSAALVTLLYIYIYKRETGNNLPVKDAIFYILARRTLAFHYGQFINFEKPIHSIAEQIYNNVF